MLEINVIWYAGDEAAVQQQWLVAGCVGAGRSAEAAADARLAAQHAVPAAGVAVRLLSQRGRLEVEPAPGATSSHYTSSHYTWFHLSAPVEARHMVRLSSQRGRLRAELAPGEVAWCMTRS